MKVFVAHVYQPTEEEIPTQLSEFLNSLNQSSSTMEDADVHVVYVDNGTELTPEFEWIKENATNVVAVVKSNKFRRHAPKDFTWQECISLKRKQDVETMLAKLNANEWTGSISLQERAAQRETKRLAREQRKAERDAKRAEKAQRKLERTAVQVLDLPVDGSSIDIAIPEGKKILRMKLLLTWQ